MYNVSSLLNFINFEPVTRLGVQQRNPQIHLIYTDKHGAQPEFAAVAKKRGGSALGTIFAKVSSAKQKPWMGKIGDSRGILTWMQGCYAAHYNLKEINMDAVLEKVATDMYAELGHDKFSVPKTRLAVLPLVDQFSLDRPRWLGGDGLFRFIQSDKTQCSIRIMSKFVSEYMDFSKATTLDPHGKEMLFIDFIKAYHRPPDNLVLPQEEQRPDRPKSVPLHGLMELIAVGRMLSDTDLLGGTADNAGFVWKKENSVIVSAHTVKIDPGKAFHFDCKESSSMPDKNNWVFNTCCRFDKSTQLDDLRDIQLAHNAAETKEDIKVIYWNALSPDQKRTFLITLFNTTKYIRASAVLKYLLYRDGLFQHLPEEVAQKFQDDMQKWIELQLKIYDADLQDFFYKPVETIKRSLETLTVFDALFRAIPLADPEQHEKILEGLVLLLKEGKAYGENANVVHQEERYLSDLLMYTQFQSLLGGPTPQIKEWRADDFGKLIAELDEFIRARDKEYSNTRRALLTGITTLSLPTVGTMFERLEQLKVEQLPKLQEIINMNAQKRWTYQRWASLTLGSVAQAFISRGVVDLGPDINPWMQPVFLGTLMSCFKGAMDHLFYWNTNIVDPYLYEHPTDNEYNEVTKKYRDQAKQLQQ